MFEYTVLFLQQLAGTAPTVRNYKASRNTWVVRHGNPLSKGDTIEIDVAGTEWKDPANEFVESCGNWLVIHVGHHVMNKKAKSPAYVSTLFVTPAPHPGWNIKY